MLQGKSDSSWILRIYLIICTQKTLHRSTTPTTRFPTEFLHSTSTQPHRSPRRKRLLHALSHHQKPPSTEPKHRCHQQYYPPNSRSVPSVPPATRHRGPFHRRPGRPSHVLREAHLSGGHHDGRLRGVAPRLPLLLTSRRATTETVTDRRGIRRRWQDVPGLTGRWEVWQVQQLQFTPLVAILLFGVCARQGRCVLTAKVVLAMFDSKCLSHRSHTSYHFVLPRPCPLPALQISSSPVSGSRTWFANRTLHDPRHLESGQGSYSVSRQSLVGWMKWVGQTDALVTFVASSY